MARVCTLFSSSKGNSTYISCSGGGVLVDVGKSAKAIGDALTDINVDISAIRAIFITHEHIDHVCGLNILSKKYEIPIYATPGTINALYANGKLSDCARVNYISSEGVDLENMFVTPFTTSHDCSDSCGYTFDLAEGRKVSVCTDLGYISETVKCALTGSDLVVIESNHDVNMLKTGEYPPHLKKRILGLCGHLSNDACASFLPQLANTGTTRFILAHLSEENNIPELAERTSENALNKCGFLKGRDYILKAASVKGSEMIVF